MSIRALTVEEMAAIVRSFENGDATTAERDRSRLIGHLMALEARVPLHPDDQTLRHSYEYLDELDALPEPVYGD